MLTSWSEALSPIHADAARGPPIKRSGCIAAGSKGSWCPIAWVAPTVVITEVQPCSVPRQSDWS